MRPTASRWGGGLRIGADFFARRGGLVASAPKPRGLVDTIDELRNPGLDPSRLHPAVVAFFEDISGLDLFVRSHWHGPFSLVWRLARPVLRWVGQLVMPLREAHVVTRVFALSPEVDGRGLGTKPRAVIRTYAGSEQVMQVVAYTSAEHDGARYLSVVFPLPGMHLLGMLRLDGMTTSLDVDTPLAVRLTSARARRGGDIAGVWVAFGKLVFRSPLGECIELWARGMETAPKDEPSDGPDGPLPGATFVGRHVQTVFGLRFATHRYWFRPVSPSRVSDTPR